MPLINRFFQPSVASSKAAGEPVLNALATPQRMLTGYLAQGTEGLSKGFDGKSYSFEDILMNHPELLSMYAAMEGYDDPMNDIGTYNLLWDIGADPTNIIGAKWLAKGDNLKGLVQGAPSNTVPNWYGKMAKDIFPQGMSAAKVKKGLEEGKWDKTVRQQRGSERVDVPITEEMKAEAISVYNELQKAQKAGKNIQKITGLPFVNKLGMAKRANKAETPDEIIGLGNKVKGFAKWALQSGADGMMAALDPRARAQFADLGITPKGQQYINEALDQGFNAQAFAQPQHVAHSIMQQGGEIPENMRRVVESMAIDGYRPMNQANYLDSASKVKKVYTTKGGREVEYTTPTEVTNNLFKQAVTNWKNAGNDFTTGNWNMVVKEVKGNSGQHVHDVSRNVPAIRHLEAVFKEKGSGFKNVSDLKSAIEAKLPKPKGDDGKPNKAYKGASIIGEDANGVYVQGGATTSSSYTEGGVNSVVYIHKNGMSETVISDVYDFLEKSPVGAAFEKSMQHKLFTVTPPITKNLRTSGMAKTSPRKVENFRVSEDISKEELRAIANNKNVSHGTRTRESARQGMLVGLTANEMTDDK